MICLINCIIYNNYHLDIMNYDCSTVFITNDSPHKHFVRSGQDLISTYTVSIEEMLYGVQFIVHTLDNKQLRVNITQVITYVLYVSLSKIVFFF